MDRIFPAEAHRDAELLSTDRSPDATLPDEAE
jgi:hypothetical protein